MSRFIPIGDSVNFRHLGGYEGAGGRRTREDALFRGGWFEIADDDDAARFAATGIRRIFDFRSTAEREKRPLGPRIRESVQIHELGISPGSMGPYLQSLRNLPAAEADCKSAMTRMHREMLEEGTPRFREFFARLVGDQGPFMIMCSTGKDRTGVVSALLLSALGVSKTTVLEDYLISADVYRDKELVFARNHGLDALGIDLTLVKDVFTVHPEYIGAVFKRIDEDAGSLERFIAETLGVGSEQRQLLQNAYLR
ncbi:tyrosine-protein phosphatase [Iodidimonas sp. SYSU 1G8]|uniref:tyrosine-protein phosphatase n=1 Tax=Iodidimonas sp. SYSU 1G8 TaxID=3133967 RepID=UPI0031FE8AD8